MFGKLAILLAAAITGAARAQQPSTDATPAQPKCIIEGTATDALTGEPLRKVTVRLSLVGFGGVGYTSTTDLSGHLHFEGVTAGDYTLEGERAGYLTGVPKKLHLQAGEKLSDLQLRLMRCSVISGKVLDENGEPVSKLTVYAYLPSSARGRSEYFMRGLGRTNDTGEYQISGLGPGRYFLYASSESERFVDQQGGPEKSLLPVFYPESQTRKNAAAVQVDAGQDLTGINFRLHTGTVFHIRGKVESTDLAKQREYLMIEAVEPALTWGIRDLNSGIERDGSFDIDNVPPGSYDLQVLDGRYRGSIATIPIEVKALDVTGIKLVLPTRLQLKGSVRMLGSEAASVSGTDVSISDARGMMGQAQFARLEADGTFQIENVWPGKYFIRVSPKNQEEYVKSILYGGEEVLGVPVDLGANGGASIEVILAKGAGQVEGTVQSSGGGKADGCIVILISERGVFFKQIDQNGQFLIKGVAPGHYYALGSAGVEISLWNNPDFYSQLRDKGVEVDLPESGHVQIQVPVVAASDIEHAIANLPL